MSSYQVSVEFDFNQESSDSDLSETADVILKVPVKVRCLEESNTHSTQIEPLADDRWIAECSREVHMDSRPEVIAVTETRLNSNSISNVDLPNYNFFHAYSLTLAGGAAIYTKDTIKAIPRPELKLDLPLVESCWVEIDPCNIKKHIMIGCIYKHPSANGDEFTMILDEFLKQLNLNKYEVYILGHMNIDLLKHHTYLQTGRYLDMLYSHDLLPVITKPTRFTSHTVTLIDHIYTKGSI